MARPEDVYAGGKYKLWKPWSMGDYYHTVEQPQISPLPGSSIKLNDIMVVKIIDDIGVYGGTVTMVYYLYDFIKEGKVIERTQYIIGRGEDMEDKTVFFDEGLEEKLGGQKEKIGGL